MVYDVSSASSCKSNNSVAFYLSCNHAATTLIGPQASSLALPVPAVDPLIPGDRQTAPNQTQALTNST